jgi:hypothetical protein
VFSFSGCDILLIRTFKAHRNDDIRTFFDRHTHRQRVTLKAVNQVTSVHFIRWEDVWNGDACTDSLCYLSLRYYNLFTVVQVCCSYIQRDKSIGKRRALEPVQQSAVDAAIIDQSERFIELEYPGKSELKQGARASFGCYFTGPHFQRGFYRSFDGPAQSDERSVDRPAGTSHHHVNLYFFTLEHFHQSQRGGTFYTAGADHKCYARFSHP